MFGAGRSARRAVAAAAVAVGTFAVADAPVAAGGEVTGTERHDGNTNGDADGTHHRHRVPRACAGRADDRLPARSRQVLHAEVRLGPLDTDGSQLVDVHAGSPVRARRALTIVCVWSDADGDGRWAPRVEPGAVESGRLRWAPAREGGIRSTLDVRLDVDAPADVPLCAVVMRRIHGHTWIRSATTCSVPEPPVDVPEVPAAALLGLSALSTASAAAYVGRRRRPTVG